MSIEPVDKTIQAIVQQWQQYYKTVQRPKQCLFCPGQRIHFNGSRCRSASVWADEQVVYISEIVCRRVKCNQCRHSWTLRPPGVIAHKHFQLCVLSRAMSDYLFDPGSRLSAVGQAYRCSRKTVKRWVCWTASIASAEHLLGRIVSATDAPLLPRLGQVTELCRKARDAAMQKVMQTAAQVLSLMECLCSALQLEPPGLKAVVHRVLGDRSGIGTYAQPIIPELVQGGG